MFVSGDLHAWGVGIMDWSASNECVNPNTNEMQDRKLWEKAAVAESWSSSPSFVESLPNLQKFILLFMEYPSRLTTSPETCFMDK